MEKYGLWTKVLVFAMLLSVLPADGRTGKAEGYGIGNPTMAIASTWDSIYFGNYWSEDTNGDGVANQEDEKQPIKWRVLSVNGSDAYLLSDQILDCVPYQSPYGGVTWESCTLRTWLNDIFLKAAFDEAEQASIVTTKVQHKTGTTEDCYVEDKVYVMSMEDAGNSAYGFESVISSSYSRVAAVTPYAECHGVEVTTGVDMKGNPLEMGEWWLRHIPDSTTTNAACVFTYGYTSTSVDVNRATYGVRPVLHLDLSHVDVWENAGKVTNEEMFNLPDATPVPTTAPTLAPTTAPIPTVEPTPAIPVVSEEPVASSVPTYAPATATSTPTETPGTFYPVLPPTEQPAVLAPPVTSGEKAGNVAKVKGVTLKVGKSSVTVKWKKVTGAKGYQLAYSTSKKMKGKKTKLVKKKKVVLKKLKKRTYYVQVRAYKTEKKKKVYGAWSKIVKVTVKK